MTFLLEQAKRLCTAAILAILTILMTEQLAGYTEIQKLYEQRQAAQRVFEQPSPSPSPTPTKPPIALPTEEPPFIDQRILTLREEYQNDDIVGFLSIPDTSIDYPVLQADDNEYYLYRDLNQAYSVAGSIYLDYENDLSTEDKNTIIYGHNMKADIMFHSLRYYADKSFFDAHRLITLNTLYGSYTWEVFSFYPTTTDFYYIQAIFKDEDEFGVLLDEMIRRSLHETDVVPTKKDRILTLSTCTNGPDDTRYVLNAKLITP